MMIYLLAFLIGAAAGLRPFGALAMLSVAAAIGWIRLGGAPSMLASVSAVGLLLALALAEISITGSRPRAKRLGEWHTPHCVSSAVWLLGRHSGPRRTTSWAVQLRASLGAPSVCWAEIAYRSVSPTNPIGLGRPLSSQ